MPDEGHHAASLATNDESSTRDREAWEQLINQELASAYRLAAIVLGDRAEAEDATHDSLIRAWHSWRHLRDPDLAGAWFQRILVNTCRDRLRRRRRSITALPWLERRSDQSDPSSEIDDRDAIGRAFATLAPEMRMTLALRFFADLSIDDVAERLASPPGTVKSRIHRGLQQMRRAMERMEPER